MFAALPQIQVLCPFGRLFKVAAPSSFSRTYHYQSPYVHPNPLNQPIPTKFKFKRKHWNPKFKKDRKMKLQRIELPDFNEKPLEEMDPSELRKKYKKLGIQPMRSWDERPVFLSSTSAAFDPYIPPEGDGKANLMSIDRAKQEVSFLGKKGKSFNAIRKIKQFEDKFDSNLFAESALQIYINLHKSLAEFNEEEIHKYATERAFPMVVHQAKFKTIHWSFIRSLEPPRVVHARITNLIEEDNLFAQITVRFNSQQTLAVYDRFGRLIHGSEVIARDVLEYVVFEKHVSNEYGMWRVHDKIVPDWMPVKPVSKTTFKLEKEAENLAEDSKESSEDSQEASQPVTGA